MMSKDMIKLNSVGSTNDFARECLRDGYDATTMTCVVADEQTKGRGQEGNVWESEAGKNLTFSLILKPRSVDVADQFFISMAASLAIHSTLSTIVNEVSIKWPNDIYVGNRKIAGILIENTILGQNIESSIIGVGVNVNQQAFSTWIPNPCSLISITGKTHDRDELLDSMVRAFGHQLGTVYHGQFDVLKKEYLSQLYRFETPSAYKVNGEVIEGVIKGVNHFGMLQLMHLKTNEIHEYAFKEIEYLI